MSETPIAEASEEDVQDKDWPPGSEELMLETEEESVGAAVDSGLDSNKEEDKEGEMKAVDVSDDDDNDISALESEILLESSPFRNNEMNVAVFGYAPFCKCPSSFRTGNKTGRDGTKEIIAEGNKSCHPKASRG